MPDFKSSPAPRACVFVGCSPVKCRLRKDGYCQSRETALWENYFGKQRTCTAREERETPEFRITVFLKGAKLGRS